MRYNPPPPPRCAACGGFLRYAPSGTLPCQRCAATKRGQVSADGFFSRGTEQLERNYPAVERAPGR